mmetsp:Transcript_23831/g.71484  ORF Transcript_23831/g.71484 Transcript_23831/m.71484 type:complete len:103 (+) Transcript_23831:69-377(+)
MFKVLALAGLSVSSAFLGAAPVRNAPQQLQAAAVLDAPVAAAAQPVVGFALDGSAVFGSAVGGQGVVHEHDGSTHYHAFIADAASHAHAGSWHEHEGVWHAH